MIASRSGQEVSFVASYMASTNSHMSQTSTHQALLSSSSSSLQVEDMMTEQQQQQLSSEPKVCDNI
jgi:hypothetical protein